MRTAHSVISAGKLEHCIARRRPGRGAQALRFGRKPVAVYEPVDEPQRSLLSTEDVRLFLTTFAAGFIFVGVLVA